jgi:PPOX class probable F420-dependent enzyme
MPTGEVPQRYRDILGSKALGHLATIGADGRPQVNPVWFLSDGQNVYLSVKPETVKYRNLRANPAVAMSISDLARPGRYLEIRGEVIAFELYATLVWVN